MYELCGICHRMQDPSAQEEENNHIQNERRGEVGNRVSMFAIQKTDCVLFLQRRGERATALTHHRSTAVNYRLPW
jgi:hypothetical protein